MPRKEFWTNGVLVNVIEPTPEEVAQERRAEILKEFEALDKALLRPLSEGETDRVNQIVAQKAALRLELATL